MNNRRGRHWWAEMRNIAIKKKSTYGKNDNSEKEGVVSQQTSPALSITDLDEDPITHQYEVSRLDTGQAQCPIYWPCSKEDKKKVLQTNSSGNDWRLK